MGLHFLNHYIERMLEKKWKCINNNTSSKKWNNTNMCTILEKQCDVDHGKPLGL